MLPSHHPLLPFPSSSHVRKPWCDLRIGVMCHTGTEQELPASAMVSSYGGRPDRTPVFRVLSIATLTVGSRRALPEVGRRWQRSPARIAIELINSWTIASERGRHTGSALGMRRPGGTRSWLGLGLGFVEGLCDLGEGVGDGLVPVHVGTAGAEFSCVLLAQSFRDD
jgi:hypothetical protein